MYSCIEWDRNQKDQSYIFEELCSLDKYRIRIHQWTSLEKITFIGDIISGKSQISITWLFEVKTVEENSGNKTPV